MSGFDYPKALAAGELAAKTRPSGPKDPLRPHVSELLPPAAALTPAGLAQLVELDRVASAEEEVTTNLLDSDLFVQASKSRH